MDNININSKKNENGFSLVEVIIAITILSSMALFYTYFSNSSQVRIISDQHSSCQRIADETMNRLKSIGYERNMNGVNDYANTLSGSVGNNPEIPAATTNSIVGNTLYERSGNNFTLNNFNAVNGSMTILKGIYQDKSFCSGSNGKNYNAGSQDFLIQSDPSNRIGLNGNKGQVNTTIRVQLQNLNTGSKDCSNLEPIPAGDSETPAVNSLGNISLPSGTSTNHGFWVTVKTEYDNHEGLRLSCDSQALFSYPRKPSSNLNQVSVAITGGTGASTCQMEMSPVNLSITAPMDFDERKGQVLFCRDMSSLRASYTPTSSCFDGPKKATGISVNNNWVPCKEVTICGRNPNSGGQLANRTLASSGKKEYFATYSGLPWGCDIRVEARLIDSAGNISSNAEVRSQNSPALPGCYPCPVNYTGTYCVNYNDSRNCTYVPPPPPPETGGGDGDGNSDGADGGDGGRGGDGSDQW